MNHATTTISIRAAKPTELCRQSIWNYGYRFWWNTESTVYGSPRRHYHGAFRGMTAIKATGTATKSFRAGRQQMTANQHLSAFVKNLTNSRKIITSHSQKTRNGPPATKENGFCSRQFRWRKPFTISH